MNGKTYQVGTVTVERLQEGFQVQVAGQEGTQEFEAFWVLEDLSFTGYFQGLGLTDQQVEEMMDWAWAQVCQL